MRRHAIACMTLLVLFAGCSAAQKREQYYMVVEPSEQSAAIYKVTAKLHGLGGTKYKLNEGYVPVNVIDALSGKVGEPPDLFSPVSESQSRSELSDELGKKRNAALLSIADAGESPGAIQQVERTTRFYGALAAAAAMTPNEQISIGQTSSTDVYAYRKLVFYASAEVIKMQEFEQELNEIEKSTSDLAKAIVQAKQAKAEEAKAKVAQRNKLRQSVLGQIQSTLKEKPDIKTWTAQEFLGVFGSAGLGGGQ